MGLRANVGMISLITPIAGRIMMYTDRKSTRLNSSHSQISYAVFCLKKKTKNAKGHCQQILIVNTIPETVNNGSTTGCTEIQAMCVIKMMNDCSTNNLAELGSRINT